MFRKEKAFKFDRGRAIIRYSVYGRLFFENKGTISHRAVTQKRFRTGFISFMTHSETENFKGKRC
ncbi:MAG: hypothetical protein C6P37_11460 [Caldibacillus debilis]|uniref:Uncharacterized protein n=1 Tax=Caldibacillus debilis TaxID=301148 RepID=A0A3E0K3Q7_9BACI|nr:hypothetical protein [Bacillaceae bacterium]OUM89973.1 MAG: hypothetical protein BAA03_11390 [Caldibacillus debilis]REJ27430.1 MAG: hypothetical protein C6P37_11460 [Caldibacillus debilis]